MQAKIPSISELLKRDTTTDKSKENPAKTSDAAPNVESASNVKLSSKLSKIVNKGNK